MLSIIVAPFLHKIIAERRHIYTPCSHTIINLGTSAETRQKEEAHRLYASLHARFVKHACYPARHTSMSFKALDETFVTYLWCMLDDTTVNAFRDLLIHRFSHDIFDMDDIFYHVALSSFCAHGFRVSYDRLTVLGIDINPLMKKVADLHHRVSSLEAHVFYLTNSAPFIGGDILV